jgi:cell wall assembly regulator SMI1
MSKLLEELAYIFEWLEYSVPELADRYNPGLSREQIDQIVKNLPFKLSEEVYELYQWRNGEANSIYHNGDTTADFLFPDHHIPGNLSLPFWSLQQAVANYQDLWKMEESFRQNNSSEDFPNDFKLWDRKWFPIASMENKSMLITIGDINPSPIYQIHFGFLNTPLRVYKSLSSMISTIAECCESELYKIIPDEDSKTFVYIKLDDSKSDLEREIYHKYNS